MQFLPSEVHKALTVVREYYLLPNPLRSEHRIALAAALQIIVKYFRAKGYAPEQADCVVDKPEMIMQLTQRIVYNELGIDLGENGVIRFSSVSPFDEIGIEVEGVLEAEQREDVMQNIGFWLNAVLEVDKSVS